MSRFTFFIVICLASTSGVFANNFSVSPYTEMAPVSASEERKVLIKEVQNHLKISGMYDGRVDGFLGPKTQNALKEYQSDNKLKETGTITLETTKRMGIDDENTNAHRHYYSE